MAACNELPDWLKANLGASCMSQLTGTDRRALAAAVQIIDLYSYHEQQTVLEAFARVVRSMQQSTWPLAYHAIAHVMDWGDRSRVWDMAGLPIINPGRCKCEPNRGTD